MDLYTSSKKIGWEWNRGCKVCGKRDNLKRCTKCKSVYYCSEQCQRIDSVDHTKECSQCTGDGIKLLPKQDPKDPCPICLEEESTEGVFITCLECGTSFCGKCMLPRNTFSFNGCPVCRDNIERTPQQSLECAKKLLARGIHPRKIYPTIAIIRNKIDIKDPTTIVYLTLAFEKGSYYAGSKLAELLENTNGDPDMIMDCHLRAASRRINISQNWLANYYLIRGEKDIGRHWHLRASENKNIDSTRWMAKYYMDQGEKEKAAEMYYEAGLDGCHDSLFSYATIQEQKGNDKEAYEIYIKIISVNPESYYKIGEMYCRGYPEKSFEKSIDFYLCGAEKENVNCLLKLGLIFLAYSGVLSDELPSDLVQHYSEHFSKHEKKFIEISIMYLDKAFKLGCSEAGIWIGDYYRKIKDFTKAIDIYKRCFQIGEPDAYVKIAHLYLSGEGVEKDTPTAIKYLDQAIQAGSKIAVDPLKNIMEKAESFV